MTYDESNSKSEGRITCDYRRGQSSTLGALMNTYLPTSISGRGTRDANAEPGRIPVGQKRFLPASFGFRHSLVVFLWLSLALPVPKSLHAFPPAPHHLIYGLVRDEYGNPLTTVETEVILETASGVQIKTSLIPGLEPGVNYRLRVPMDSGITSDLYKATAMRPTVPFRIRVRIGRTVYLPIEMTGDYSKLGQPAQQTRLNLTLGEDSDGDGIPDAWERALLAQAGAGKGLSDIRPGDDTDHDGLSNLQEYLAGTYAFDNKDGFALKAVRVNGALPVLEFIAIRGRTYEIFGSSDLQDWTPVEFRIPSEGAVAAVRENYQAVDVRVIQAEVTAQAGESIRFFKLRVQ